MVNILLESKCDCLSRRSVAVILSPNVPSLAQQMAILRISLI